MFFCWIRKGIYSAVSKVGGSYVKPPGQEAKPFKVLIPLYPIEKGKITDTFIREHMQTIAQQNPEEDFRLPENQPKSDVSF